MTRAMLWAVIAAALYLGQVSGVIAAEPCGAPGPGAFCQWVTLDPSAVTDLRAVSPGATFLTPEH